ncbi:MAG: hypothetical protein M1304_03660 [Candidatus Thermoplasmatota archaeon]|nr:hypothetical protein [Candidatus Thermoplasmatota archaeon]MCL5732798.1 hypothetical protein [Candidatus Thermoplasmatota archaeon]
MREGECDLCDIIVSINDGITLKPSKKLDKVSFEKSAIKHRDCILSLKGAKAPEIGEAKKYSLEDELST